MTLGLNGKIIKNPEKPEARVNSQLMAGFRNMVPEQNG